MKGHRSNVGVVLVVLLAVGFLLLAGYTQAMLIRSEANRRDFSYQRSHLPGTQPPGFSVQGRGKAPNHHLWRLCKVDPQVPPCNTSSSGKQIFSY